MTQRLRLHTVQEADVYKAGVLAGSLVRGENVVTLRYRQEYADGGGPPIATTLPVAGEPVVTRSGALPPFFAGLLPEGRRLSVLQRALKTSADDELTLLLAVGGDTVGDVAVVPHGQPLADVVPLVPGQQWSDVRFTDLLLRSTGTDADDPLIDAVALAGVQAKVSSQLLSFPVAAGSARWILKLTPPDYPYLVENEAFFLALAAEVGLEVAPHEVVVDHDGQRGLLVRRFDRVPRADGSFLSLAQEDACQVLGRYPADKYNLTYEEVVSALTACTRAPSVAAVDLFRQIVFAYLTGDGDVHAKNLSVGQRPSGEWRVTPGYDVPTTRPYGDTTLALTIDGRSDGLSGRHLIAFAREVGIPERAAGNVLDLMCDHAESWIDRLDELPFDARRHGDLTRMARRRRTDLRRR